MSYRLRLIGSLAIAAVAMMLLPRTAAAADLDPGYADVPAPIPQQNVTFGSGWYIRGDIAGSDTSYKIGAARTASANAVAVGIGRSNDPSYGLSLGGGYSFTNSFRVDLVGDFIQPTKSYSFGQRCISRAANTCSVGGLIDRYDVLVNGYYDFGTWSIVTPYVGAGAGYAFGTIKTNLYGDSNAYSGRLAYHGFAYALMAGAAFDVYQHVKLDIGYRFLDQGRVQNLRLYNHQVRAGIRYMIDN